MTRPAHMPGKRGRRTAGGLLAVLLAGLLPVHGAQAALFITIVQGLGGMPEYDARFDTQRQQIEAAARALNPAEGHVAVFHGGDATRDALLTHFDTLAEGMTEADRALIYLIGHGSFNDEYHKFNIPGIDIDTEDLDDILESLPGGPHALVNTASTSGALLEPLAGDNRLLMTATRSGNERNATEFGTWLARALNNEEADLNKNGFISLQEAFDFAERQVVDFFESSGRLATEHPQLVGDGADRFNLARLGAAPAVSDNEELNALREQRLEIDAEIESLQLRRDELDAAEYSRRLRALVLESATLSEQIDALSEENDPENGE